VTWKLTTTQHVFWRPALDAGDARSYAL